MTGISIWNMVNLLVLQTKSCLTCQLGKFSEVGHRPKLNSRKKIVPMYFLLHESWKTSTNIPWKGCKKKSILATCPSIHMYIVHAICTIAFRNLFEMRIKYFHFPYLDLLSNLKWHIEVSNSLAFYYFFSFKYHTFFLLWK